jgi:hypothetical protein
VLCVTASLAAPILAGSAREPAPATRLPFALSQPIPIDARSPALTPGGTPHSLVWLSRVRFTLDPQFHLTAKASGGVQCAARVNYEVRAAVFDAAGRELGIARVACPVERLVEHVVVVEHRVLALDFGTSKDYGNARSFTLRISQRAPQLQ